MPSDTADLSPVTWTTWPSYDQEHYDAVDRVIRSNQLFNGPTLKLFEHQFAEFTGSPHAVGVGNATQGLHLALAALGVGENHEVIVTPYSWISSASCILMQNATPVFADIEPRTFGLDPNSIKKKVSSRTKAVILVHMFGYPAEVREIADFCRENDIFLVEDCSHAFGVRVGGQHVGLFGDAGVFSLQQRKPVSTGDGGIAISKHASVAEKIARLRSFGDEELSYNYRMSEFAASLGLVGLNRLNSDNQTRIRHAEDFSSALSENCFLSPIIHRSNDSQAVYYGLLIDVGDREVKEIDAKIAEANNFGVPIKRTWQPLNLHPHFNPTAPPARGLPWANSQIDSEREPTPYSADKLPVAYAYQQKRLLEIELHPLLSDSQITDAAEILSKVFS